MTASQQLEIERLLANGTLDPEVVSDVEKGWIQRRFVYIVHSAGLYKIGFAANVRRRLASINCSSPNPVELIWTIETAEWQYLERQLHQRFAAKHRKGEWFALDSKDIHLVRASARLPILLK